MIRILALDQATMTGFAACEPGGPVEYGSQRIGPSGAGLGVAGLAFQEFIEGLVARFWPTVIVREATYVPRQNSHGPPMNPEVLIKLHLMAGLVDMAAAAHGIECREVTPAQAARHFTGHGRWGSRAAKKEATIDMARRMGWSPENDNEADALAILMIAEAWLAPREAMRRQAGPIFLHAR